jgi:gliding motility-associated-like protein
VQTNQQCSNLASSLEHNNILLRSIEFESDSSTLVSWNEYINWDEGVEKYEIWRKTDDRDYVLVGESDDPEEMYPYGYDGFDFCYRIKAVERNGNNAVSWSNESCVDFVPSIKTYNFFSPNEDAFNQYLTFDRVGLYPNSVLTIYNRYGAKIKEFKNYQNDWDGKISGKLVPAGTYFYALKLNEPRNSQPFIKGYFSIMY